MIMCGHHHVEDDTCGLDDEVCMGVECSHGLYEIESEDQGDMSPSSSSCKVFKIEDGMAFQCTMPDWA